VNVDLYVRSDGWLHRLDPRTRFAFTLIFIALALIVNRPVPMLATLLVLHVTPLSSQIPVRYLAQAWRALWPITLMIIALSSLTLGAGAANLLVRIGPFSVTGTSLSTAITMALRVDCLAFAFLVTLWTTPQGELVAGLTRLGLPHGASLTLAIAMQFVPTFGRIFGEIMEAQQSRGLIIPRLNPLKAARAYLPVLVPLLITALRTADNLSMALSARGYGAGEKRTSRRQLHMAGGDWLTLAALAALLALSLLWRLT
jgi:energy-coupling factor transporter transmembrane protein EcfT